MAVLTGSSVRMFWSLAPSAAPADPASSRLMIRQKIIFFIRPPSLFYLHFGRNIREECYLKKSILKKCDLSSMSCPGF